MLYIYINETAAAFIEGHTARSAEHVLDPEFLPVPPLFKLDLLIHDYVSYIYVHICVCMYI